MPSTTSVSSTTSPTERSRRVEGRLYVFAVTSLAAFLVGLALWRPPVVSYTVRAIVAWAVSEEVTDANGGMVADQDGGDGSSITELVGKLRSDETLASIAGEFGVTGSDTTSVGTSARQSAWARKVRGQLTIRCEEKTDDGSNVRLVLEYRDRDRRHATQLIDELTKQCAAIGESLIETRKTRITAERQKAAKSVRDAQDRLTVANSALDNFVVAQLKQMERDRDHPPSIPVFQENSQRGETPGGGTKIGTNHLPAPRDESSTDADQPIGSAMPDESMRGSDWTKLRQDLAILKSQIRQLMDGGDQSHSFANSKQPARVADDGDDEVQPNASSRVGTSTLDSFNGPSGVPNGSAYRADGGGTETRGKTRNELLAKIRQMPKYGHLQRQYSNAESAYQKAVVVQTRLRTRDWSEAAVPPQVVQAARVVRREGGGPGPGSVLPLGWISVTIGCCFAMLCRFASTSRTFRGTDEVAKALDVNVVGAITTGDGPEISPAGSDGLSLVRYATRAGEATLAAVVVLMALIAATDHFFARQFLQDPFSAYADAIDRVTTWMM